MTIELEENSTQSSEQTGSTESSKRPRKAINYTEKPYDSDKAAEDDQSSDEEFKAPAKTRRITKKNDTEKIVQPKRNRANKVKAENAEAVKSADEEKSLFETFQNSNMNQIPVLVRKTVNSIETVKTQIDFILLLIKSTSIDFPFEEAFDEMKNELSSLIQDFNDTGDFEINFNEFLTTFVLGDGIRDVKLNLEIGFAAKNHAKFEEKFYVFCTKFVQQLLRQKSTFAVSWLSVTSSLCVALSEMVVKSMREVGIIFGLIILKEVEYYMANPKNILLEGIDEIKKPLFDLMIGRFRDVHYEIRLECLNALRDLMLSEHEVVRNKFITNNNLLFFAQSLVDKNDMIRKVATIALGEMLHRKIDESKHQLRKFFEEFKERLLEIMTLDNEDIKNIAKKALLLKLVDHGYLELNDENEKIFQMLSLCLEDEVKQEKTKRTEFVISAKAFASLFKDKFLTKTVSQSNTLKELVSFFFKVYLSVENFHLVVEMALKEKQEDLSEERVLFSKSDVRSAIVSSLVNCFSEDQNSSLATSLLTFENYKNILEEESKEVGFTDFLLLTMISTFQSKFFQLHNDEITNDFIHSLFSLENSDLKLVYELVGVILNHLEQPDALLEYIIDKRWLTCTSFQEISWIFDFVLSKKSIFEKNVLSINKIESKIKDLQLESVNDETHLCCMRLPSSASVYCDLEETFKHELAKFVQDKKFQEERIHLFVHTLNKYLKVSKAVDISLVNSIIYDLCLVIKAFNSATMHETSQQSQEEHLLKNYEFIFTTYEKKKLNLIYSLYDDLNESLNMIMQSPDRVLLQVEDLIDLVIISILPNVMYNSILPAEESLPVANENEINCFYQFFTELLPGDHLNVALFKKCLDPFERKELAQFGIDSFKNLGKQFMSKLAKSSFANKTMLKFLERLNQMKILTFGTGTSSEWFGSAIDFILNNYVKKLIDGTRTLQREEDLEKLINLFGETFFNFFVDLHENIVFINYKDLDKHFNIVSAYTNWFINMFFGQDYKVFNEGTAKALSRFLSKNYKGYGSKLQELKEKGVMSMDVLEKIHKSRMTAIDEFALKIAKKLQCEDLDNLLKLYNIGELETEEVQKKVVRPKPRKEKAKTVKEKNLRNLSELDVSETSESQRDTKEAVPVSGRITRARAKKLEESESDKLDESSSSLQQSSVPVSEDAEDTNEDLNPSMEYNSSPEIKRC